MTIGSTAGHEPDISTREPSKTRAGVRDKAQGRVGRRCDDTQVGDVVGSGSTCGGDGYTAALWARATVEQSSCRAQQGSSWADVGIEVQGELRSQWWQER